MPPAIFHRSTGIGPLLRGERKGGPDLSDSGSRALVRLLGRMFALTALVASIAVVDSINPSTGPGVVARDNACRRQARELHARRVRRLSDRRTGAGVRSRAGPDQCAAPRPRAGRARSRGSRRAPRARCRVCHVALTDTRRRRPRRASVHTRAPAFDWRSASVVCSFSSCPTGAAQIRAQPTLSLSDGATYGEA